METLTQDQVIQSGVSTAHKGRINATYSELLQILGQPTYDLNDGLDKTNFEWFVLFKGRIFSIYDWKCTAAYSVQEREQWLIGAQWNLNSGSVPTDEFLQELNERISNVRKENVFSDKFFIVTIKK